MFRFDSRTPTSLDAINQYIGSYATPEAAEADTRQNAPQGMDYLQRQYQSLTGDAFADPFRDATRQRQSALATAALHGASVASGSNMGGKLLSLPTESDAGAGAVATGATSGGAANPSLSPLSRDQAGDLMRRNISAAKTHEILGREENQPGSLATVQKRAQLLGVGDLLGHFDPKTFDAPAQPDALLQMLPGSKKVISDERLHPIALDPKFEEIKRQHPEKAVALYHAVTGRDYQHDVESTIALHEEQRKNRKDVIAGIKNPEYDEVTGELYHYKESTDPITGKVVETRMRVNPNQQAALDYEGGFKHNYGYDLPGKGGLPKLKGASDSDHSEYIATVQQLRQEHPEASLSTLANTAQKMLHDKQKGGASSAAYDEGTVDDPRSMGTRAGDAVGRFALQSINSFTGGANEFMSDISGGHPLLQIPQIPVPRTADLKERSRFAPSIMDVMREGTRKNALTDMMR